MNWLRSENRTFETTTRGGRTGWRRGFYLFGSMFAFERSNLYVRRELYMKRWLIYVAGYTLRLHKFYRGDDDKASHTHPWWFITFPLGAYVELLFEQGRYKDRRVVKPWRPHFRPADFEHYVGYRAIWHKGQWWGTDNRPGKWATPFYTIVITGRVLNEWGFYPFDREPRQFIPHWEWA